MQNKIVIEIGEIDEDAKGTPIQVFEQALRIWEEGYDRIIETNNIQFLDALQTLFGTENIEIYLRGAWCHRVPITLREAYKYLYDIYDIIVFIYFNHFDSRTDQILEIDELMGDYNSKWEKILAEREPQL